MYRVAKKIAEDVPHNERLKANIVDFIADAVPEHMTEKICKKISSENGMMEVLHNERYLIKTSRENPRLQSWDERRQVK